jgi:hypothetical protein
LKRSWNFFLDALPQLFHIPIGATIDKNLNWDAHRTKLVKKLATSSGILSRIKDNIPNEFYEDLYHTMFESHLTIWYNSVGWSF